MEEVQLNGGYDNEGVIWHQHSNHLLIKLMELLPKEIPIIDIGCGHNFYVNVLNYCGWKSIGVDAADLGSKHFKKADVTKPIKIKGTHNVISFEVGEHIPLDLCDAYIDNLCAFNGDVIVSWAIEGQKGIGHINCQNNEWVIAQFNKRGYTLHEDKTNQLRFCVQNCHCNWFKNNLMYFTRL